MKTKILRILALLLISVQLFSLIGFAAADDNTEDATKQTITNIVVEDDSITDIKTTVHNKLIPTFTKNKFLEHEKMSVCFNSSDVVDYTYFAEGLAVEKADDNSMQFTLDATEEFGRLDVYADYADGETVKSSIYTYKKDGAVYISDISKDRAWYNCMEALYLEGELTEKEIEAAYADFSLSFSTEATPVSTVASTSSTATVVNGTLSWQLEDETTLPLRQAKVELWDDDITAVDSLVATTYTDNNGFFSFSFENPDDWFNFENGGADVYIKWYNESYTFQVNQDLLFTFDSFQSPTVENVSTGTTTTINRIVTYDETNNVNKSTYVHQGMVMAQRFAVSMGMPTNNFIHVIYPGDVLNDDSAFCWGTNEINCYSMIGLNEFNDIDTLTHEYGHFVEVTMENYGSTLWEILTNGPTHKYSYDNFTEKSSKEYAMELTWSEAWATVFAQMSQKYHLLEYIGIPDFGDNSASNHNFESPAISSSSCEAQELAVIAVLWDIFDYDDTESFDNINLHYQNWWYYTTHEGTYTLTDFVDIIESRYPSVRDEIGALLANYQISPGNLRVTNSSSVSETTPPTLSWKVNGSTDHPNDIFQVVFYDKRGNFLGASDDINCTQAYNTYYSYTVPSDLWNQIIENYGGTFTVNVAVRSYRSGTPISGPYLSSFVPITLTVHKTINMLAHNRYVERVVKLDEGSYCNFTTTFPYGGYKILQTFGTKDAEILLYSADGTLLASNDDSGYNLNAFIRYNFSANTTYVIRVKMHSTTAYGETKLGITPANAIKSTNSTSLSTYEDISGITNSTNFALNTYAAPNCTRVVTFTPPSSGDYTFTIESDIDTYMYVIDPRSSELLILGTDYDDDSGEAANPLLTKTLSSGIKYLIVYSAWNPSSLQETVPITIRIYK